MKNYFYKNIFSSFSQTEAFQQSGVGVQATTGFKADKPLTKPKHQVSSQLPKVPIAPTSKQPILTQSEENESRTTTVMATSLAGPR